MAASAKALTTTYVKNHNGLAWLGLAWLGLAWLGLAWLGEVRMRQRFVLFQKRIQIEKKAPRINKCLVEDTIEYLLVLGVF